MHRLGPFAGLQHEVERHSDNLFVVQGARLLVTEDADAHAAVEQCLVPWMGDEGNLMDRYDARMLLDNLSSFDSSVGHESYWSAEADPGATAEELDTERYADLDPSKEHLLATAGFPLLSDDEADQAGDSHHSPGTAAHRHQGPAFALEYTSTSGQPVTITAAAAAAGPRPRLPPPLLPLTEDNPAAISGAEQAVRYLPPYEQIPGHLEHHLPHSQRQHQIIAQTAKFVRSNGNQVEVLLRVKHGANPNFAFLMNHDRLFPYYRWLVEQAPRELAAQQRTLASQQQQQTDVVVGAQQPGQGGQQGQQQEVDQPSSSQAAAPAAAPESGEAAGEVGALELLRVYSMNSEADSDVGVSSGQQQQEAAEHKVQACSHDDSQLVFGPALPPGFPAAADAADAAATGDGSAASPLQQGPEEILPQGCPSPQQQQQPASPASPDSNSSAGEAGGLGTPGPAQPPDTVRAIIDKLVAFVKKNGIEFERVVRSREQNNPPFAFLHPDSMHHAYYKRQLEEAVGPYPVRELFNNIKQQAQQAPEGSAQAPHMELEANGPRAAEATVAAAAPVDAAAGAAATTKVVLKANPRLVPKRPLALPAAATVAVVATDEKAGSPTRATWLDDHQPSVVAGDGTAPDDEQQPGPGASKTVAAQQPGDPTALVQQQDAQQQQPLQPGDRSTTTAVDAGRVISSAGTQAQKRLRLQMYLRQRRAEQLAEEQQQENDTKARAILAHRQLLNRAAAGADDSDRSSVGDAGSQPEEQDQQQEVEEGEIPEEPDPPASAAKVMTADAAARAEAMRLLQRSPEPVDTTLPGLKELASSAAAAAAKHRAALMLDSDDEKTAEDGPADKQRQMLAAALKAAHEAAAAAGVGVAAGIPAAAAAAPSGTSLPATAAQPVGAVVNMAAAANAAAAVIAAQAAGVPAMLVQPQLVTPPLLQESDTVALTAATSAAAAAAAAVVSKQQVDSAAANGHPASTSHSTQVGSSSDSGESSDSNGSAERPRKRRRSSSRPGDRSTQSPSSSRSGSRSTSRSRSRSKPSDRQTGRPHSALRRGDTSDCRHNSSRRHKLKHKGQSKAKSKGKSRHRSSRDKHSKRSRSPKAEADRGRSHKHGKRAKHMVHNRSKHRQREASTSSCSGSDDKLIGHQGRSSAAVTAASVAAQPTTQPTIAATAPGNIPLAGLPVLDNEQLRQRLRQMMGKIR